MNALLKDNWIKALRSGKYSQGYGRLYNPSTNCHCVLGVLCRVADIPIEPGGIVLQWKVR